MKVPLATERTRRVLYSVMAFAIAAVWLYEYPLYLFLYLVNASRGGPPLDPVPPLTGADGAVLVLLGLMLLWVYARPRSYLVLTNGGGAPCALFVDGAPAEPVDRAHLRRLRVKAYSQRRGKSRDSGYIESVKIHPTAREDVVLYDAVRTWTRWKLRWVARGLERGIGDVEWKDDGLLSGQIPEPTEHQKKRARQRDAVETAQRHEPPPVAMRAGGRVLFVLVFGGFGAAFYYGGAPIAGYVFWGLAALMLGDLVLALLGFGQQPAKK